MKTEVTQTNQKEENKKHVDQILSSELRINEKNKSFCYDSFTLNDTPQLPDLVEVTEVEYYEHALQQGDNGNMVYGKIYVKVIEECIYPQFRKPGQNNYLNDPNLSSISKSELNRLGIVVEVERS